MADAEADAALLPEMQRLAAGLRSRLWQMQAELREQGAAEAASSSAYCRGFCQVSGGATSRGGPGVERLWRTRTRGPDRTWVPLGPGAAGPGGAARRAKVAASRCLALGGGAGIPRRDRRRRFPSPLPFAGWAGNPLLCPLLLGGVPSCPTPTPLPQGSRGSRAGFRRAPSPIRRLLLSRGGSGPNFFEGGSNPAPAPPGVSLPPQLAPISAPAPAGLQKPTVAGTDL